MNAAMDGFFRILKKALFQLICTRLYVTDYSYDGTHRVIQLVKGTPKILPKELSQKFILLPNLFCPKVYCAGFTCIFHMPYLKWSVPFTRFWITGTYAKFSSSVLSIETNDRLGGIFEICIRYFPFLNPPRKDHKICIIFWIIPLQNNIFLALH